MKKRSLQTILFSTVGVVAMLLIIVAFNAITASFKQRVDLTQEKAYTLSQGTKAILAKLDAPVRIRFYCTQSDTATPDSIYLKGYAQKVEDLLGEFKQASRGNLIIEKFNPQPDSDAEDKARFDGIEGKVLSSREPFYLGLSVSRLDARETIGFFEPQRERLLEYDIARAISRVVKPEKPVVGVMSALPVFGMASNPMMMQMGQRGSDPWVFVTELKNDFTVRTVPMETEKIDDDIKLLVVIHPRDITDKAQFALDQFVLRGGKLIAWLDAFCLSDSTGRQNQFGGAGGGSSTLEKLFKAWGVGFEPGKVVADMTFKMQLMGQNNQPVDAPTFLDLTPDGVNKDDVATSQLDNIWLPFVGAFTGTPTEGLKKTVLLKSTKDSQLVEGFLANLSGETVIKDFKPSGTDYALAIRLSGKFKTAFPDGLPEAKKDEAAGDKKPEEKPAAKPESLKESKAENVVYLFGDADMLANQFSLDQMRTPFGNVTRLLNANLNLAQNLVEQLSGDENLIGVRSRASLSRPFTRIKEMESEASRKYMSMIKSWEDRRGEAQRKINELQQKKPGGDQRFVVSPEQKAELDKLQKEAAEANRQLRQVEKDLRKEVVSLQNKLKWFNIAVVPLAVAASGIVIALYKRKRTAAK